MGDIKPTIKQERVFKDVYVDKRSRSLGEAMIKAGYSKVSASKPSQDLTNKKGWKYLLDKHLPDNKLLKVHNKLLDSKDERSNFNALKLGYDTKGYTQPEVQQNNWQPVQINIQAPEDNTTVKNIEQEESQDEKINQEPNLSN